LSTWELGWLLAGGIFYTAGTVFYHRPSMRYSHAVWHLFVLAGSVSHFLAVLAHAVYGTIPVHSGLANLLRASTVARPSSSVVSCPSARPCMSRKLSTMRSITVARGRPVWLRSGSTRLFALWVALSESFSRPIRSTCSILAASMS